MTQIFNSWRDANAVQHYPFTDFGPPTSVDGKQLSTEVVLDASVHPANAGGGFYLASITVTRSRQVVFSIGSSNSAAAATGIWDDYLPDPSTIPLYDSDNRPAGVLVVSPSAVDQLRSQWPNQTVPFIFETAVFAVTTWHYVYSTPDVSTSPFDTGVQVGVADDLYLVGEDGIRLICDWRGPIPVVNVHGIGDPLARLRECTDEPVPRFIREVVFQQGPTTISCFPNDTGDVFLVVVSKEGVDSSLRLRSRPGDLQIGFSSTQFKPTT